MGESPAEINVFRVVPYFFERRFSQVARNVRQARTDIALRVDVGPPPPGSANIGDSTRRVRVPGDNLIARHLRIKIYFRTPVFFRLEFVYDVGQFFRVHAGIHSGEAIEIGRSPPET